MTSGETISNLENPASLPPVNTIDDIREPIIEANILVPQDYVGAVIGLCEEKRGHQMGMQYLGGQVSQSTTSFRMSEVVLDFLRPAEVGQPGLCLV